MLATIALIFQIAGTISADLPEFVQMVSVVKGAIAAFESGDQGAIDAAHKQAEALADSLKPAGV